MAQTGYTPILIYSSSTGGNAPAAGNLTNSTLGSELAINITDGKLFYKDNANAVQVIGWKVTPTSAGGTGLTSYTAGDTLYYASGTTLSKLAIGGSGYYMSSSGTAPQWSAPAALTKTDDTNVTLTLGGSASTALLNAASLTLGWTGQLAASRGGTGIGTYTAGDLLYASGTTTLSKLAIGTANYVLTSSGSAPQWTAGSSVSVGTASNLLSNATTGVMQIVGPAASTTRVMTIPNSNFTAARTDAAQTFSGTQTLDTSDLYFTNPANSTSVVREIMDYVNSPASTAVSNGLSIGIRKADPLPNRGASVRFYQTGTTEGGGYASTYISFWTYLLGYDNGKECWRIDQNGNFVQAASGYGVNFTANSAAAGMTSQLLNWYEEGTWTPVIYGTGSAGVGTYSTQVGTYTRIGRVVYLQFVLSWSAHTGTGNMRLSGLPFTSAAASKGNGWCNGYINNVTLTAGNICLGMEIGNSNTIGVFYQGPTGGGAASAIPIDTAADLEFSGFYFV